MDYRNLLITFCVGIGATLLTDLWNLCLKRIFKIQSLDFCLLGRWILYMPHGKFRRQNIKAIPAKSFECVIGWFTHYSIGIILTIIFIIIVSVDWINKPALLPAICYGIVTVVFPLFIMQPSFGLGLASSNTPNPGKARFKSIMTHIIFGVGLWLTAIALKYSPVS